MNKILDCKIYKSIMCWKYKEGWRIDSFADNSQKIYTSFNKCKDIINNAIKQGNIIIN